MLTTDYVGNKIYENGTLKRILIDGGYIKDNKYYYYLTDHLGNNRAVADPTVTDVSKMLIQRTHYYLVQRSLFGVWLQPTLL